METQDAKDLLAAYAYDSSSDFVVGEDKFENLQINKVDTIKGFHYFKDASRPLSRYVRRFILKRGQRSAKVCIVTLIQQDGGKFEPRFDFQILNLTKKAVEELSLVVDGAEQRLIKARVNLDDC